MKRTAFILFLALTSPAFGQEATPATPTLKADVRVTSDLVRIGDLVDNAGSAATVAVFRAPDPGNTGSVPVERVLEALRPHGVIGLETQGLTTISVTRLSRVIGRDEIEERIAREIAPQLGLRDTKAVGLTFDFEPQPVRVPVDTKGEPQIERLSVERRTGRFNVIILLPGEQRHLRFAGIAAEVYEATTLTRPLSRGDLVRASDIAIERRPRTEMAADTITDSKIVVGQAAKRALRPGQPLRQADLMRPELVQRNEPVMIVYYAPGITLTLRGKALDSGAEGDIVNVQNIQSKRSMQGLVSGIGEVTVAAPMARLAANFPSSTDAGRR